jgi:hypothetical protein
MICNKLISLPDPEMAALNKESRVVTYCILELGHAGECVPEQRIKEAYEVKKEADSAG